MKTLVIYYSYSGHTKKIVENIATKENADIIEVKDKKKQPRVVAYISGSFKAFKRKQIDLQDFNSDFSQYDKLIIAMPIWAEHPAPAINNIINILPSSKEVELIMVSGSGSSKGSKDKTIELIASKGCNVTKYEDIKG